MRWLVSLLGLTGAAGAGHLGLRWLEESARRHAALGYDLYTSRRSITGRFSITGS